MSRAGVYTVGVLAFILMVAGVVTLWLTRSSVEPDSATRALADRPDVAAFTDLSGQEVSLNAVLRERRVVVVNSWASWCPFCVEELRMLDRVAAEFSDDVRFIAINRRESVNQANRFLQTVGELKHLEIILDPDDRFYADIAGYTAPETIFFNQRGEAVIHHRGVLSEEQLRSHLTEVLGR